MVKIFKEMGSKINELSHKLNSSFEKQTPILINFLKENSSKVQNEIQLNLIQFIKNQQNVNKKLEDKINTIEVQNQQNFAKIEDKIHSIKIQNTQIQQNINNKQNDMNNSDQNQQNIKNQIKDLNQNKEIINENNKSISSVKELESSEEISKKVIKRIKKMN